MQLLGSPWGAFLPDKYQIEEHEKKRLKNVWKTMETFQTRIGKPKVDNGPASKQRKLLSSSLEITSMAVEISTKQKT